MKTYKVQQIVTLYMESTVEANSKKEALELLESGEGDFSDTNAPCTSKYKVLEQLTKEEAQEFFYQQYPQFRPVN